MHNRQTDGGYTLTHSLYNYDGPRASRVDVFSVIEQLPIRYQEAPIAIRS